MLNSEPLPESSIGWLGIMKCDLWSWLFQFGWAWGVYWMGVQTKTTPWRRDCWDHDKLLEDTKAITTMAVWNFYNQIRRFPETLFSFNSVGQWEPQTEASFVYCNHETKMLRRNVTWKTKNNEHMHGSQSRRNSIEVSKKEINGTFLKNMPLIAADAL